MIDLHTHILPHVDDGARNIEEAYKMTECLMSQNVTQAVCTPHFDPARISLEEFIEKRNKAMRLLESSPIELITGSETMLHEYLFHYMDIKDLCISNTRYLLIELPLYKSWDMKGFQMIEKLINYYDIVPIIAHVERYQSINIRDKVIKRLRNLGCFIQTNTSSIVGKKSRGLSMRYMKKDYIDVIGSDCHNMGLRPPVIKEAYEIVIKNMGEKYWSTLQQNAECIVKGESIKEKTRYK